MEESEIEEDTSLSSDTTGSELLFGDQVDDPEDGTLLLCSNGNNEAGAEVLGDQLVLISDEMVVEGIEMVEDDGIFYVSTDQNSLCELLHKWEVV